MCSTEVVARPVWSTSYTGTAPDAVRTFRMKREPWRQSTGNLLISKSFGLVVKTNNQVIDLLSFQSQTVARDRYDNAAAETVMSLFKNEP